MSKTLIPALIVYAIAFPATAETLTVNFASVEPKGNVMVALYLGETAFAGGAPIKVQMVPAANGSAVANFKDLDPGAYGIKAFHDLNANGTLDKTSFGLPTEPYAFSNNAKGSMGPATWADAAFEVKGDTVQDLAF